MGNPNPFLKNPLDDVTDDANARAQADLAMPLPQAPVRTPQAEAEPAAAPAPAARRAGPTRDDVIRAASAKGVDPALALSIWSQESSSGRNPATSDKGARGGFQVMPGTYKAMMGTAAGQDDPWNNMEAGLRYIAYGQKTLNTNNPALLAAGYHAGYDRNDLKRGIIPDVSDGHITTAAYATQVAARAGGQGAIRSDGPRDDGPAAPDGLVPLSDDEVKTLGLAPAEPAAPVNPALKGLVPLSPDEIKALNLPVDVPQVEAKGPSFMDNLKDAGKLLKSGADTAALDLREAIGRIPGVGQSIVQGADAVDRYFHPEAKDSGELLKNDQQQMTQSMTPQMQAALQKKWWDSDKGTFGAAWSDPRAYVGGVLQSLPEQAVTMVPAMRLAKFAYGAKIAAGAAEGVAAAAAARTAMVAGAISEGALGGAQSAREVRDSVAALPQSVLDTSEAYKTLVGSGMSADEARAALASDLSTRAFVTSGIATGLFGGMGDRAIAKIFTEQVGKSVVANAMKGFGKAALAEGLFEEAPQSALQQVAQNEAMQKADPRVHLSDDVANQAVGGAVLGAVQGGGMGAIAGNHGPLPRAQPTPDAAPQASPEAAAAPVPPSQTPPAPAAAAPAPRSAAPLSSSLEQAASPDQRVVVTTPQGESASGTVQDYAEDEHGNYVARIRGDDGQVYTLTEADGVQITPVEEAKGPLSSSLESAAEEHASVAPGPAPAPEEANAPAIAEASTAPAPEPAAPQVPQNQALAPENTPVEQHPAPQVVDVPNVPARAPEQIKTPDQMGDEELRTRLKYLAGQFRNASDRGVQRKIGAERRAVEAEINRRATAPAAVPESAAPQSDAPAPTVFDSQGDANRAAIAAAESTGLPHEVVERDGKYAVQPIKEVSDALPATTEAGRVERISDVADAQSGTAVTAHEPGPAVAAPAVDAAPAAPALTTKVEPNNPHGGRWFSTQAKADAYLAKKKIGGAYEVKQTGKVRFEIVRKAETAAPDTAPAAVAEEAKPNRLEQAREKHAKQDEAVRQAEESIAQSQSEKDATPQAETVPDAAQKYTLPDDPSKEWRRIEARDFQPTPRQKLVMDAVENAKADGKFYTKEVQDHVAKALGVDEQTLARNTSGVEGGDFGYDVYMAEKVVEAQGRHAAADRTTKELNLKPGDKLGTLIFNDFKQNTGVTVESVEGDTVRMKGKRGAATVTFETTPSNIKHAIERAHEKGRRKDGYEDFIASRAPAEQQPQSAPAKEAPAPEPQSAPLAQDSETTSPGDARPQATSPSAPASAREEQAEPDDDASDIPLAFLKKVTVPLEVWVQDEGAFETLDVPADQALASVREDITNLRALLGCMRG